MTNSTLPKGWLSKHISHVELIHDDDASPSQAVAYNGTFENGKIERVETCVAALKSGAPSVYREDGSRQAISGFDAALILAEVERLEAMA